jgi:hypothetical protein
MTSMLTTVNTTDIYRECKFFLDESKMVSWLGIYSKSIYSNHHPSSDNANIEVIILQRLIYVRVYGFK